MAGLARAALAEACSDGLFTVTASVAVFYVVTALACMVFTPETGRLRSASLFCDNLLVALVLPACVRRLAGLQISSTLIKDSTHVPPCQLTGRLDFALQLNGILALLLTIYQVHFRSVDGSKHSRTLHHCRCMSLQWGAGFGLTLLLARLGIFKVDNGDEICCFAVVCNAHSLASFLPPVFVFTSACSVCLLSCVIRNRLLKLLVAAKLRHELTTV